MNLTSQPVAQKPKKAEPRHDYLRAVRSLPYGLDSADAGQAGAFAGREMMAGDSADDLWDAMFDYDGDVRRAVRSLMKGCPNLPSECPRTASFNDDGLLECPRCKRVTDV